MADAQREMGRVDNTTLVLVTKLKWTGGANQEERRRRVPQLAPLRHWK